MQTGYRNLVFEGGGVKGIAYGGALQNIESLGILENVQRCAGTSAGAITATLLAVGYNSSEITNIISQTNFLSFEDAGFFITASARVIKNYGWNKGNTFDTWIGSLIQNKIGNSNITFRDLLSVSNSRELFVVCSNITQQEVQILSHETTPDMIIKDAVRMSMSIPLFFQSVKNSAGDTIVDGGVTLNYPINIFDDEKYLINKNNGLKTSTDSASTTVLNYETLGFRVGMAQTGNTWTNSVPVKNIIQYTSALINFMIDTANNSHLNSNDWDRTVIIDSGGIQATNFSLTISQTTQLIQNGQEGVLKYFKWRNVDPQWALFPKL